MRYLLVARIWDIDSWALGLGQEAFERLLSLGPVQIDSTFLTLLCCVEVGVVLSNTSFTMMLMFCTSIIRDYIAILLPLLVLALTSRFISVCLKRTAFRHQRGCEGAKTRATVKDPILGVDFLYSVFFSKAPIRYLDATFQSFRRLGRTYTVERWTWKSVFTKDPENIKHMLAASSGDFDLPGIRVSVLEKLFGKGIFSVTGHTWSHYRTVVREGFKRDAGAFVDILERHFQNLVKMIPTDGSKIDLQPLFMGLTMDVATEKFMGRSTYLLSATKDHSEEQQFVDDYDICSAEFAKQMQLGPLHFFRFNRKARRAKQRMFGYVDTLIKNTLRHQENRGQTSNLLCDLVASTKDHKALTAQVLHVLLASRDTTASLLSNMFFMLAKNPRIYNRLREEVLRVAGEDAPTPAQLRTMTYLKWCVNECTFSLDPKSGSNNLLNPVSIEVASRDPIKCARGVARHDVAPWRRQGWDVTPLRSQGRHRHLHRLRHAPG